MTNKKEIYKCEICGNIIEIVHEGAGELVCCGQPMKLQKENRVDASQEKHYIEWIEATSEKGETARIFLKPGDKPEAKFSFKPISAREYCNLHGLWKIN